MIPAIGSEWLARDGRRMRVEEVVIPTYPDDEPWAKVTVLNARKGMRRKTTMGTSNFSDAQWSAFLRPADPETKKTAPLPKE